MRSIVKCHLLFVVMKIPIEPLSQAKALNNSENRESWLIHGTCPKRFGWFCSVLEIGLILLSRQCNRTRVGQRYVWKQEECVWKLNCACFEDRLLNFVLGIGWKMSFKVESNVYRSLSVLRHFGQLLTLLDIDHDMVECTGSVIPNLNIHFVHCSLP